MMTILEGSWDAGLVGFEEVSIPVLCLLTPGCKLGRIGESEPVLGERSSKWPLETGTQVDPAFGARAAGYMTCERFLHALTLRTHELWHPVKNRTCLAAQIYLDTPEERWDPTIEEQAPCALRPASGASCRELAAEKRQRMCPWCNPLPSSFVVDWPAGRGGGERPSERSGLSADELDRLVPYERSVAFVSEQEEAL
jgi:hypothetical protein